MPWPVGAHIRPLFQLTHDLAPGAGVVYLAVGAHMHSHVSPPIHLNGS